MAITYRGRASGGSTASSTSFTKTLTSGVFYRDVAIVVFTANSAGSGFAAPTISDNLGAAWGAYAAYNATGLPQVYIWVAYCPSDITSTNNWIITINCAASAQNYGYVMDFFGGMSANGATISSRNGGTSTTPSQSITPPTFSTQVVYAVLNGNFTSAQGYTEDTDTVGGDSWHGFAGYFNSSAQANLRGAYKVVDTSGASQTYNPTLGTSAYWNELLITFPVIQTPSTSDTAALSDLNASSVAQYQYPATTDLATTTDTSNNYSNTSTSDLAAVAETSLLSASPTTSDLAMQSESSLIRISTSDLATQTDSSGNSTTNSRSDLATVSDASSLLNTPITSDLATTSDSSSLRVTTSTNDTSTVLDTSYMPGTTPTFGNETYALTDSSSMSATRSTSDLATTSDNSAKSANTSLSDLATVSETSFVSISRSDSATVSEVSIIGLNRSDMATTTDADTFGQFRTDSATVSENRNSGPITSDLLGASDQKTGSYNYINTSEVFSFLEQAYFFYPLQTSDDPFGFYEASVEFTKPRITEDPIYYPVTYRVNKDFRIIAQDHFTRKFIHWDLPIDNVSITYALSGPNLLHGTMSTRMQDMATLDPPLMPDRTWLHVEENGEIRGSFLLTPFVDDPQTQTRSIEAEGFSAYPHWLTYQGDAFVGVQVDPADMIRKLWDHLQSYPDGNLNVQVGGLHTPVKIGEPPENVSFTTTAGVNVSFQGGPYALNYWSVTNLGDEIDKLCKETPIDYLEYSRWNESMTDVEHMILLGYPRMGTKRKDLTFREGENLSQLIPSYQGTNDNYASEVIVIGAGNGPTAIRAIKAGRIGLLRKTNVIQNQEIINAKRAQSIADFEFNRIAHSRFLIQTVQIDMTHINAPWGSFSPGDDILIECNVDYIGYVQDWYRIISYTYNPYLKVADLALAPSDSFTYGAENLDPYSQLPTAGYATLAQVQDYSNIAASGTATISLSQMQGFLIQSVQIGICQGWNLNFSKVQNDTCFYWYWIKDTPDATHVLPQINAGYGPISVLADTNKHLVIGKTLGGYIITGANIVLIAPDGTIGQQQSQQSDKAYPNPYYVPSTGSGQTSQPNALQQAAQLIINRITSGQSVDQNLNWPNCPYIVYQYGNYLISDYLNYRNMPLIQFLAAVVNGQIS